MRSAHVHNARVSCRYALTGKEVKMILMQRLVKVDGKTRTDTTYPAGFMDVIELEKTNEHFRCGRLASAAGWQMQQAEDMRGCSGLRLIQKIQKMKTGAVVFFRTKKRFTFLIAQNILEKRFFCENEENEISERRTKT
jgi:hypothetical protein